MCDSSTWERSLLAIFTSAFALVCIQPLWSVQWLPAGDLGGHVQLMDIILRHQSPDTNYSEYFTLSPFPSPNIVLLTATKWLRSNINLYTLGKIFLSVAIIALPLSLMWLARTLQRSPWPALAVFPLAYGALINTGMLNYIVSLPILFVCLALLQRSLSQPHSTRRLVFAMGSFLLLFFCHAIMFLFGVALGLSLIIFNRSARRNWRSLLVYLPSMLCFLTWFIRVFLLRSHSDPRGFSAHYPFASMRFAHPPPLNQLLALSYEWTGEFLLNNVDEWIFASIATIGILTTLISMLMRLRHRKYPSRFKPRLSPCWLIWLASVALCFILPWRSNEVIAERLVLPSLLLFLCLWKPQLQLRVRAIASTALLILSCVYMFQINQAFAQFEKTLIKGLPEAISQTRAKSRLAYVMRDLGNPLFHKGPLWHLPQAIFAIEKGGISSDCFADAVFTPVRFVPQKTSPRVHPSILGINTLLYYDAVLVYSPHTPSDLIKRPDLALQFHKQRWWLFTILKQPLRKNL